jgi:hypothetical protein
MHNTSTRRQDSSDSESSDRVPQELHGRVPQLKGPDHEDELKDPFEEKCDQFELLKKRKLVF